MIRAILFDFDGVLVDSVEAHIQAWKAVVDDLGIKVDPLQIRLNEGSPAFQIIRRLAEKSGVQLSEERAKQLAREKSRVFQQQNAAVLFPDVATVLDTVRESGLRCGLVTGTTAGNLHTVLPNSILDRFEAVVTESDTLRGKPFPDPFLEGARRLNTLNSECMAVENAPLGIQAARAANMLCVALTTTLPAIYLKDADTILSSHEDFLQFLQERMLT